MNVYDVILRVETAHLKPDSGIAPTHEVRVQVTSHSKENAVAMATQQFGFLRQVSDVKAQRLEVTPA